MTIIVPQPCNMSELDRFTTALKDARVLYAIETDAVYCQGEEEGDCFIYELSKVPRPVQKIIKELTSKGILLILS